jgi:RNA polymerase subunit RPABC4/transcription elongation factor Spt4
MTTLKRCPVCGKKTKKSKDRFPRKACGDCRRNVPLEDLGNKTMGRKRMQVSQS